MTNTQRAKDEVLVVGVGKWTIMNRWTEKVARASLADIPTPVETKRVRLPDITIEIRMERVIDNYSGDSTYRLNARQRNQGRNVEARCPEVLTGDPDWDNELSKRFYRAYPTHQEAFDSIVLLRREKDFRIEWTWTGAKDRFGVGIV